MNGSNQKTYYTGNDVILNLETYFKLIHEIINNKKIISDKNKVDESNLLNCEVLNKFESFGEIDKSNVETKLKNLIGSFKGEMKKVIITGGAGFLGSKLSETLNNSGYEVLAIGRKN